MLCAKEGEATTTTTKEGEKGEQGRGGRQGDPRKAERARKERKGKGKQRKGPKEGPKLSIEVSAARGLDRGLGGQRPRSKTFLKKKNSLRGPLSRPLFTMTRQGGATIVRPHSSDINKKHKMPEI